MGRACVDGDTRLEPERETADRDIGRAGCRYSSLYAGREFGDAIAIIPTLKSLINVAPPKLSIVLLILEKAQPPGFVAGALYSHVLDVAMATSTPQHAREH